MSGFEVVGVIVGAIPLIVSGLEHYANGVGLCHLLKTIDADEVFSRFP